jgi:hypothetical protein
MEIHHKRLAPEPPGVFYFEWRRPGCVLVTSARRFRFPTPVLNRYPGIVIGVCLYWRHRGLSFLWGRPHWRPE